jgi:hypothetical protein
MKESSDPRWIFDQAVSILAAGINYGHGHRTTTHQVCYYMNIGILYFS